MSFSIMMWRLAKLGLALGLVFAPNWPAAAQQATVTAHIEIKGKPAAKPGKSADAAVNASEVVVWLNRLDSASPQVGTVEPPRKRVQLVQKNKSFQPHLLVIPVGSMVDFPNRDPFFHNVFSLFDGKRFDLGLYEAGATNSVRFDRLGVSFLFCNIHPEMSAVVVAVDTNFFGVSDSTGNLSIPNVPDGKYELHVWYERSLPEDLKRLSRTVTVSSPSTELGTISVPENANFTPAHKNKYGQDYTPPSGPTYPHP
jgi:plastocyanin